MATEKLRAELEILTAKAEKDLARVDRSLAGVEKRVASIGGKGGKSLKPLGEGLSAATVNANEFEKSMAAANARVIAFGASAGLIIQVQRALKETVRATIEVEKSLTDINVVLGASSKQLASFGDRLFKVAAQTGQSFKTIAVGATELARQGLGTEKTLKRLNDAMILSRLTGMGAEEAVSSLTAAVNSFNKAGITSAQVVNKMAKVDQAFAVSSDDLAKAISRVGSSAVDAGVSMDELLAITTAVQQRTARGGAVIGNAFKTIFTRIGRTDVQKKLTDIGVATKDMTTGAMLPATKVLENLAVRFDKLSQSQQNQLAESVAGVFQVNILRAALGDLSSKYGIYNRALRESASATNEAYLKNEQLNQTLSALVNKTLANLTKTGAAIGGATLQPAIENVLNLVNSAIGAFDEGGRFEKFGQGIGKDLMKGIGEFIAGPGLVLITAGIGKLAFSFGKFATDALRGFADIGRQAANRKALEASITAELQRQPAILKQIQSGELSAASAAKDMLAAMKATNLEANKLAVTSRSIASSMVMLPGGRRAGRAQGFVPNFADPNAERASAAMGGYKAGAIRTMSIPGQGSVMYNSAETVKQFPGMQQPAIMPPQRSLAGANYKKAFGAAHGFDPYAAGGFVPNFNKNIIQQLGANPSNSKIGQAISSGALSRDDAIGLYGYSGTAGLGLTQAQKAQYNRKTPDKFKDAFDARGQIGIVALTGGSNRNARVSTSIGQLKAFKPYLSGLTPSARKKAEAETIAFTGIQVSSLDVLRKNLKSKGRDSFNFSREINQELIDPLARIGAKAVGGVLGNQADKVSDIKRAMGGKRLLPTGTEGELFEKAMQLALHSKTRFMQAIAGTDNAPFDFEEAGSPTKKFKDTLGFSSMLQRADAKRTASSGALRSLIKKSYNQGILIEAGLAKGPLFKEGGALPFMGRMSAGNIRTAAGKLRGTVGAAGGLVPNFSPLTDAIIRERAAGVPASAIRVGSSPALKSSGNPGGLGVYNTIHEPGGLGQGISRSRSMGINPKTHGVPNFVDFEDARGMGAASPEALKNVPAHMISAGGKIIIESPGGITLEDSVRAMEKNTEAIKESTKASKPTLRERAMGAVGRFKGGNPMATGIAGSVGYMAAPMIGNAIGADPGGIQGAMSGAMIGSLVAPAIVSALGILGAPMTGGLSLLATAGAVGVGGYAGYQMGKEDPELARRAERDKLLQEQIDEQKDFGVALEALIQAITQAQQATGLTKDQRRGTINRLQGARETLLAAGGRAGFDRGDLLAMYEKGLGGDINAGNEFREALEKSLATAARIKTLNIIKDASKDLMGDPDNENDHQHKVFKQNLADARRHANLVKQADDPNVDFDVLQTDIMRSLEDGGGDLANLLAGKKGQKLLNAFEKSFTEVGVKGVTPRNILLRRQLDAQGVDTADLPDFDELDSQLKKAMSALVQTKELSEDYVESFSGLPDEVRKNVIQGRLRALVAGESYTKAELEFINKREKNFMDLTEVNKTYIRGLLDESIQLQKAKQAIQNALSIDLLRLGTEKTITDAQAKSSISLAAIRGGDRAGLDMARRSIGSTVNARFDIQRRESLARERAAVGKARNALSQKALSDLANAVGMGKANFQAFQPTEVDELYPGFSKDFPHAFAPSRTIAATKARDEINKIKDAPTDAAGFTQFLKDRIVNLQAINGLGTQEQAAVRNYISSLNTTIAEIEREKGVREIIPEKIKEAIKIQEALNDIQREELEARKRFQPGKYLEALEDRQLMADTTVGGLTMLRQSGVGVTGAQIAAAKQEARRSTIARGEKANSIEGFTESFRYNSADAAFAIDDAMTELGASIKDSTKTAIQDIASGASSFKEAFGSIMASIADNIANRGIDMGVDTLFGFLAKSKGGPIPRGYNQGGVVTGGSGVRDDVMTFMQGGEYVIKKSAAQKIGYSTLNAINNYASGGKARVSLAKDFMYTGDDPTRPTGGGFRVSRGLSTRALFRDDDPQTGRIFKRQETLASYLEYRRAEQARRDAAIQRVKDQKRARLTKAYIGAAGNILGGMKASGMFDTGGGQVVGTAGAGGGFGGGGGLGMGGSSAGPTMVAARGGSPALVQGGEYIMSPRTTAKYGTGFMAELNRGRMPGFNMGGLVGGGGGAGGGITTNNVNLAINVDKSGQTSVQAEQTSGGGKDKEREDKSEIERQKKMGEAIRGVVLKEIERQQRPGGLLRDNASYSGGRRI